MAKLFRKAQDERRRTHFWGMSFTHPLGSGAFWPQVCLSQADFRGFREIQGGLARFGVEAFRAKTSKPFVLMNRNPRWVAMSKAGDTFL